MVEVWMAWKSWVLLLFIYP